MKNGRMLFTIAALFNVVIAVSLLFAWPLLQDLLQLSPAVGAHALLKNVAAVLILAFGYSYFMVSRDSVTYRAYISLGAVAKLMVVLVALPLIITSGPGYLLAWLAIGDLLFAVLFILFLRQNPHGIIKQY